MPQFGRHTKTRGASFGTSIPTVEHFAADMAPAIKIEWSATDGKNYRLCLYGDEIIPFTDAINNGKLAKYSSLQLCVRAAAKMFLNFDHPIDMTVTNLHGDGNDKYRLTFEKVDPLI